MILGAGVCQAAIKYPVAKKVDVTDDYFGTKVADPYRWLENDTSAETAEWVKAENKVTQDYLKRIPFRQDVRRRITELANYEKMGAPFKVKGKYYYFDNNGLQNQSVLYVKDALDGQPRVVLDPNKLSADGTVALQQLNFSHDGRYLAYVITRNGSDWNEIYVLDLVTGNQLADHIKWAKFTDAQWLGDGFFYSAYDAPEDAKSSKNEYHKVMYHRLGTPQSADYVEYRSMTNPLLFYQASVSDDERYVFVWESDGDGNRLYVKDLKDRNPHYVRLAGNMRFTHTPIGVDGGKIYVHTNADAPCWKVVAFDAENLGENNVADFIPEKQWVLSSAEMADHKFIITYDRDASNHPYLYSADGKELAEIKLPTFGSVSFSCKNSEKEVFYTFTSFTTPASVYGYDMESGSPDWCLPQR